MLHIDKGNPMFQTILVYIFSIGILFSSFMVITVKNTIYACLWLIFTFCISASLWILMQAEFLGIVLVMVYVGAVMVLFLFVVMMLDIDYEKLTTGGRKHLPLSFFIGVLMSAVIILVLINPKAKLLFTNMITINSNYNSVKEIGKLLITEYVLAFELAAVLLVLGMIAAIALVNRKNTNSKYIQPKDQLKVNSKDRIRIIKMDMQKDNLSEGIYSSNPPENNNGNKNE